MYRWLLPAVLVLPAWLVFGWLIFSREPWSLLPILLIFVPAVFLGQLAMTLLVRSRSQVREEHAVSWYDVGAFGAWHLLTIMVGFYTAPLFSFALPLAIVVGLGTLALVIWELWTDGRRALAHYTDTRPRAQRPSRGPAGAAETIVVSESSAVTSESAAMPTDPFAARPRPQFGERDDSV